MVGVTLTGEDLDGFAVDLPAASVRLLIPSPGVTELVMPSWNGNEFLLPGGHRPALRTFTPRRFDPGSRALDIEVVVHGGGVASTWAAAVEPGFPAAISGPGRGYTVDRDATEFLLAGDETAIPAISQLLEVLPAATPVQVHIEIAGADARLPLPAHPRATVTWHDLAPGAAPGAALLGAVEGADIAAGARIWVAGEAAGVQRIRKHLFDERGLARGRTAVRGYWKHGRGGDVDP
jgi:NADPH-dependent ferric siderophore reductase